MKDKSFYIFLHRQIPVFIALSLFPGLGYLLLGWINHMLMPALFWYLLVIAESVWGYTLYRNRNFDSMSVQRREEWYRRAAWFFYSFFGLWVIIFLLYVGQAAYKLHYIAIFTEIGASVVASSLLAAERRLYRPTIYILMLPLLIYFLLLGEWYGYVLSVFSAVFTWVLLYAAQSANRLLLQANHQASHDGLTGIYNRQFFIEHLQNLMNALVESKEYSFLLLIDLDHFKTVNDSLGHDVGDKLLQAVVARLLQHVPADCVVARLGGDEFVITGGYVAERPICEQLSVEISRSVLQHLKEPYLIGRHHLHISASIGVSLISGSSRVNANNFIKEADIAMYEVKARGRDGVFVFNEEMATRVERNLEIERLLHFALEKQEITLHYQAQLDSQQRIIGAEALARWDHPELGSIPPAQFIHIAEQTGLIVELGAYIMVQGFKQLREWREQGIHLEQLSLNISMRQFTHYKFAQQVEELMQRHLDEDLRHKVVFELTESIVAEDIERVIEVMQRLKKSGIRFSMDDFGTGYSSLSYLQRLPFDEIKIDRSFVSAIGEGDRNRAMILTILNMAHILQLSIVAEGVETTEQFEFLLRHECQIFQGYLYSRALTSADFELYYRSKVD